MFFSRKKESTLDLSWLNTDIHSHLIPGIDDGSPDIQTSVELIRGLSEFGYKKLVTTPHVLWEIYPNTSEIIMKGLGEVRAAIKDAGIDVSIVSPAATESEFGDNVRRGRIRAKFKPTGSVQSAEEVARSIVECIRHPKLEVYPNRSSRLLTWASALSPAIVDRVIANYYKERFRVIRGE